MGIVKKMRNVKGVPYHVFLSFIIHFASSTNDEFYCKVDEGNYEICRKCPTLTDKCEIPRRNDGCQCDNIKFTDANGILKGGSSCEDEFEGEKLCYVTSFSNCTDKKYSNRNIGESDIWLNGPVYYSKLACYEENQKEFAIGNEDFLPGIKITTDNLILEGTRTEQVKWKMDSPDECWSECNSRRLEQGFTNCGAWSFDASTNECYLHSVDACCGQHEKREEFSSWISGYYCPLCWSTRNECPCALYDRNEKVNSQFLADGRRATTKSNAARVSYSSRPGRNRKTNCRWIFVKPRRRQRGSWRCKSKRN